MKEHFFTLNFIREEGLYYYSFDSK